MTLKSDSISLQRRRLMIAGAALTVVPAAGFATARSARAAAPATARHATALVVSGRLLAAGGQPLAGASILAWQLCGKPGAGGCSVISDADGRFVFSTAAPHHSADGLQPMHVTVTPPAGEAHYAELRFERGHDTRNSVHAQTLLDHGTLRASFELTLS